MNRRTRDEILIQALNLLDNPALDQRDRPNGTIVPTALTIGWLQDGLDLAYHLYPIAGTIVRDSPLTIPKGATAVNVPSNCLLDYKNGLVIRSEKVRCRRRSLDTLLNLDPDMQGVPRIYAFDPNNNTPRILPWPKPDKDYQAYFTYYSLPPVLGPTTVPNFPSDYCLVEYVHLRGQEWVNAVPKGTALNYMQSIIGALQRAGIGSELEDDELGTFDLHRPEVGGEADWMS